MAAPTSRSTSMAKGLFMNVSAAGHVYPTFGIVRELTRRGDEITYIEAPPFQKEIGSFGASFIPYPDIAPYPGPSSQNQFLLPAVLTWCAREWIPKLLEPIRKLRPNYIVHDSLCLWGRILAQRLKIPAACSTVTAGFTQKSFTQCPRLKKIRRNLYCDAHSGIKLFRKWRHEIERTWNVNKIGFVDTFTNHQPVTLVYHPPELQPYVECFDDRFHFVGPCDLTRARETDFPWNWLDERPLVLVSFGTIHDPGISFFQACAEAARGENFQMVMALGPGTGRDALPHAPDNVLIRQSGTLPQLELLQRAQLFIMHGAGGGLRESALHAVPMLAVPQTYEQEIFSAQMCQQGVGLMHHDSEISSDRLKISILQILGDPSFQKKAARLRDACQKAGGVTAAVDAIQSLLNQHR